MPVGIRRLSREVLRLPNEMVQITEVFDGPAPCENPLERSQLQPNVRVRNMPRLEWELLEAGEP